METSEDVSGDYLRLEKSTFEDLKNRKKIRKDIKSSELSNPEVYDEVASAYLGDLKTTFGLPDDETAALWSYKPSYYKTYGGEIENIPDSRPGSHGKTAKEVMRTRVNNLTTYKKRNPQQQAKPESELNPIIENNKNNPTFGNIVKESVGDTLFAFLPSLRLLETTKPAIDEYGKETVRGARDIIAESPQALGSLVQEMGERAEEMPDLTPGSIDMNVARIFPMAPLLKAGKALAFKMTDTDETTAEMGKFIIEKNKEWIKENLPDFGPSGESGFKDFMYHLGGGAVTLGTALGVTALTKTPHAASGLFGLYQKGQVYQQAREKGIEPRKAGELSTIAGGIEGSLEYIGLDFLLKRHGGKLLTTAVRAGTEGAQEFLQTTGENLVVKMGGIDKARGVFEGAGMSALVGLVLGAPASVAIDIADSTGIIDIVKDSGLTEEKAREAVTKIIIKQKEELLKVVQSEAGFARIGKEEEQLFKKGQTEEQKLLEFDKTIKGEGFTAIPATPELKAFIKNLPENISKRKAIKQYEDISKKLGKPLPAAKVAPIVKEATGIKKPVEKITQKEDVLLRQRLRDEARGAREGYKAGRVEARETINEQIRTEKASIAEIKQSITTYAKEHLTLHDRGKLLDTVKGAKSYKDLMKSADMINTLAEKQERRTYKTQIKEELAETKVKKQAGKPVGKFTPQIQKVLDLSSTASKMTKIHAREKIDANIQRYKDNLPPAEVALENKVLSMMADTENMSTDELLDTLTRIKIMKETGKMIRELDSIARRLETGEDVKNAINIITGGKGLKPTTVTTGIENADKHIAGFMNRLGKSVVGWDDILDMLSSKAKETAPYRSWLSEFGDVTDELNAEKKGNRLAVEKIRTMTVESFGLKTDRELINKMNKDTIEESLGVFNNADGNNVEIRLSKAEARKRWMELQDPSLRETFTKGMKYTPEIVETIKNFLSEGDKTFVKKQMEFYQEYYNTVNPIYSDIYGVNLPKNESYSPIKRSDIDRTQMDGFGEFLQEVNVRASIASGSLKSRVTNIKPLQRAADTGILQEHISELEHFKAWADKARQLRTIFGNSQVREAIVSEHGKGMMAMTDNFINDFIRKGSNNAAKLSALDKLRINFTRGALAIKPALAVKQLTSFIAYADDMPVGAFVEGVGDFFKITKSENPVQKARILLGSEMMKARGKNIERDIKAAMQSDAYSAFRKNPSFLNSLMLNIQIGDKGAILVGGWSYYKHQRKSMNHNKALKQFERITTRTQQSGDISQQSFWQRGGSFAKLFTMFRSTQNQYFRKELGALRNLLAGRGSKAQHAKTIVIFHFLLPMFFQWVSDFGRWDKKEQTRAAIFGSLNGLFIAGDMLDALIRKALGMRVFDSSVPIYGIANDLNKAIRLINDDDITTEDILKAVRGILGAVSGVSGIPAKQTFDIASSAGDLIQGEYYKGVGKFLGWSPYVLEKGQEKEDPVKAILDKYGIGKAGGSKEVKKILRKYGIE